MRSVKWVTAFEVALSSATKNKLVTHLVQQKLSWITALEINENTFVSRSIFTTFVCLLDIVQANAMNWLKPISCATKGGGTIPRGMSPLQTRHGYYTWKELWNPSGLFMSKYVWLKRYSSGNVTAPVSAPRFSPETRADACTIYTKHACTQTHTSFSHLQPREVMKTNGRVLFPLGTEEELSHQANFILVWPRDSISSGCFYKCRAAPRHRPVMDMRTWWPDGRCWPCNSSSKHSLMTPPPTAVSVPHPMKYCCLCANANLCFPNDL